MQSIYLSIYLSIYHLQWVCWLSLATHPYHSSLLVGHPIIVRTLNNFEVITISKVNTSRNTVYNIYIYIYIYIYISKVLHIYPCPVGWGCRIHRLHLCRGYNRFNECPRYNTRQSGGEFPVMLELWGMRSTPSLPLLPDPLWPRMVASGRVLSIGQIELNCRLMLNWIVWIRTVFVIETVLCLTKLYLH